MAVAARKSPPGESPLSCHLYLLFHQNAVGNGHVADTGSGEAPNTGTPINEKKVLSLCRPARTKPLKNVGIYVNLQEG